MDITYEHVTKQFGDVAALSDFSLHVADGEFMVMLGPSGCGKTTALRCLAGLERPSIGLIKIGQRVVNNLEPRDRDVSLVFQSYALYPHMSVRDNIMYPLRIRGMAKAERERQAQEVADRLEIGNLMDRRPRQLSGGQRQRVALARAIVRDPACFLMDEPLSNLDAKLRVHMRAELKHLQKSLGTTTLYVTHDQAEAMTMADRVAVLSNGVLLQVGTIDDIYRHPINVFVATFVGSPSMNLLPVSFEPASCQLIQAGLFAMDAAPLLPRYKIGAAPGDDYVLGVRPEDFAVSLESRPNGIPAEIYAIEPMGNEALVAVDAGDARLIARAAPTFQAPIGTHCWLTFEPSAVHLFESASQKRVEEK